MVRVAKMGRTDRLVGLGAEGSRDVQLVGPYMGIGDEDLCTSSSLLLELNGRESL